MLLDKLKKFINFPFMAAVAGLTYIAWYSYIDHKAQNSMPNQQGKVIIQYWEKWTGPEFEAMQSVVDDFNKSQSKIFVKMLSVSTIDQKLMLATAGGNPPDLAGVWSHTINTFAGKGALTPLDGLMKKHDVKDSDYIPVFLDLCRMYGVTWALPSTPATIGLHWNKKLFREAGLEQNTPPESISELNEMAEQLTIVQLKRDGKTVKLKYSELTKTEKQAKIFSILQLGYSPSIPGWFNEMWGFWFGANLWNGKDKITASSKANIEALRWYCGFPEKYGLKNIQEFGSSFGNFASPQDPFLSGKVAMVLQGVWMHNYISKYAPAMKWGAAAFPSIDPKKLPMVCIAESDVLVIPSGAKHVNEAFEFIKYVQSNKAMEKLTLAQRKFPPLAKISDNFIKQHPNPYIKVFIELAKSPNARHVPKIPIWNEYKNEFIIAYDQAQTNIHTPTAALNNVEKRSQWQLDRVLKRWELVKKERFKAWRKLNDKN